MLAMSYFPKMVTDKAPGLADPNRGGMPELLRAARNVGEQTPTPCPVCAAEPLVHVTYVFGDALRQANGRVWPRNGLADLHRSMDEVACYVVEVCTACYWNHLAQRYLLGRRHVG